MPDKEILSTALKEAVVRAKAPGAVACLGKGEETFFIGAAGARAISPRREPATEDTIYDLASLTKVVATTTAVMLLRDRGELDLDSTVSRYIPLANLDGMTVRNLITHTAGLIGWDPLYKEISGFLAYVERIARDAQSARPGISRVYSDLGFILLAKVIEQVVQESLDVFCRETIFNPLDMKNTGFKPPDDWKGRCAPTEECEWRKRLVRGEVHDQNASAIGGVSGHAGLFSTAGDLEKFCRALLHGRILSEGTLVEMTRIGQVACYPWQGLGWWLDPWTGGANGFLPARTAFGHTGWTGTSIWMDRDTKMYAILLSNTCHPTAAGRDNTELRRHFYTKISDLYYRTGTNAHSGLDKLLRNDFEEVKGKGLAILTNSAATDQTGRSICEVFRLPGAPAVKCYFSPEHGFSGQAEAGERVTSQQQGTAPIISLYGDKKFPSREDLRGVDVLVVDLPDVGARYYTYMATMKACMEACAEHHIPVMVLDRPNPLGGTVMEGPVADVTGPDVCCAPLPIRHGMTLGEIAQYFQKTVLKEESLDLRIITAENWWRDFMHPECSLEWSAPSPNIPSADAALMYVGNCLFEGLNLNEGRGTEQPFQLCGAPWLDVPRVLELAGGADVKGCLLKPTLYIPKVMPGKASNPRFKDKLCHGIRFEITDRHAVRPLSVTLAVIGAIHRIHPELEWLPFFDTLAGGPRLREQLQSGKPVGLIIAGFQQELEMFDQSRPRLYQTLAERASS